MSQSSSLCERRIMRYTKVVIYFSLSCGTHIISLIKPLQNSSHITMRFSTFVWLVVEITAQPKIDSWSYFQKYFASLNGPQVSPACCCGLWMMQIYTWPGSHTCWGHMVLIGLKVYKWVKFNIFRLSFRLTSHDLWPSFVTFDLGNTWRFPHYINKPSLVPIRLQLFK